MLPNRPEFLEVAWGCQLSGLYYTPVNTHLTFDEVAYIVDDSEARAVFIDASMADLAGQLIPGRNPRVELRIVCRRHPPRLAAVRRSARRGLGRCPSRRTAPRCCTPRARPGGRRRYAGRCPARQRLVGPGGPGSWRSGTGTA